MDKPSTPAQHQAIRRAAQERVAFVQWIAAKLLVTDDKLIRVEASKILIQLTESK
jgi:hypothetical protein